MEKRAGERDTEEQEKAAAGTPDAKKRKGCSNDGATILCDDVMGSILARIPARTAVASMALSKRHWLLIRSVEFRSLHRLLAPPLPRPHITYLVTATLRTRLAGKNDEVPASVFHGFHVAGAGGFNGNAPMPMRALAGPRLSDVDYVNNCNGIVLLASQRGGKYSARCRCILWNPAVADVVEEVTVVPGGHHADASTGVKEYLTLGLGYGRRSETYKLVLLCRCSKYASENYSLLSYALADLGKQPTEIELPAVRWEDEAISQRSLYIDGKIYLILGDIHTDPSAVLAFDVDDETVTCIDLPIARGAEYGFVSGLMEFSGRPCVVAEDDRGCALWLLNVDHQWHRRCLNGELNPRHRLHSALSIIGVWDCGGVLIVLCYRDGLYNADKLFVYDITTGKIFRANLESVVTLECLEPSTDLALCWGYRPTLEAPSSVIGKPEQDKDWRRKCSTYIMKALKKPVAEQDRRKGQEATLNIVCFMDFLVRIMQKLPKDMQKMMDPDFTFENVLSED